VFLFFGGFGGVGVGSVVVVVVIVGGGSGSGVATDVVCDSSFVVSFTGSSSSFSLLLILPRTLLQHRHRHRKIPALPRNLHIRKKLIYKCAIIPTNRIICNSIPPQ